MNHARRHLTMASGLWLAGCASSVDLDPTPGQHAQSLKTVAADGRAATQRFWLYLPPGYRADGPAWPLVFFLHGSGERGTELQAVKVHGPPKWVDRGRAFPFILVSPQLGDGRSWDVHELQALSLALQRRLRVDAQRITVTGLSLGGQGAWNWAIAYADQLAAIAPVCGFGDAAQVCAMRQVPVRAYHGAADDVVPLAAEQAMVDALRQCGGRAELIVYPGIGHNAWDPAYVDAGLYEWLLAARRGVAKAAT